MKIRFEMVSYRSLIIMILIAVIVLSGSNIRVMAEGTQTGENGGIVTNNSKANIKIIKREKYFSSPAGKVAKVSISVSKKTIKIGDSLKLSATVKYKNNKCEGGSKAVSWSCTGCGEIKNAKSTSCTVVGKKKGKMKVTAKSKQNPKKKKVITIRVK